MYWKYIVTYLQEQEERPAVINLIQMTSTHKQGTCGQFVEVWRSILTILNAMQHNNRCVVSVGVYYFRLLQLISNGKNDSKSFYSMLKDSFAKSESKWKKK